MQDRAHPEQKAEPAPALFDAQIAQLDTPIWSALSTRHLDLALGDERARRYPTEIGPLSGIPSQSAESYAALGELAGPNGVVVLFSLEQFQIPPGWTTVRTGEIYQMVRQVRGGLEPIRVSDDATIRQLTAVDAPAMVALAELTEPGPFRLRTMELGSFYGIFHGDRLMAMAGKRMHLPGLIEVSGVCTHPDARGRGYARLLMSIVIEEIEHAGETAFLHVLAENPAIRIYEPLGFAIRQRLHFAALVREG
jgi:ribosomal protein S18 acetylase RimI-like enzyme